MRFDHPLLGRHRRVTALGIGYSLAVFVGAIIGAILTAGAVDTVPPSLLELVDGFFGALILAAMLSATVLPIAYAGINGGPVTSAAIALAPTVVIIPITGQLWLTNDVVMALVVAAIAVTLAVTVRAWEAGWVRSEPDRFDFDGLLLASGVSLVAVASVIRFTRSGPTYLRGTIQPLPYLVVLAVIGCLFLWITWAPAIVRSGSVQSADR